MLTIRVVYFLYRLLWLTRVQRGFRWLFMFAFLGRGVGGCSSTKKLWKINDKDLKLDTMTICYKLNFNINDVSIFSMMSSVPKVPVLFLTFQVMRRKKNMLKHPSTKNVVIIVNNGKQLIWFQLANFLIWWIWRKITKLEIQVKNVIKENFRGPSLKLYYGKLTSWKFWTLFKTPTETSSCTGGSDIHVLRVYNLQIFSCRINNDQLRYQDIFSMMSSLPKASILFLTFQITRRKKMLKHTVPKMWFPW